TAGTATRTQTASTLKRRRVQSRSIPSSTPVMTNLPSPSAVPRGLSVGFPGSVRAPSSGNKRGTPRPFPTVFAAVRPPTASLLLGDRPLQLEPPADSPPPVSP